MEKIHFVGIKGVGMAALAICCKSKGYQVTGSDVQESYITEKILNNNEITVNEFSVSNIEYQPDLVIVSAAYGKEHIEVKEARKKHLEVKWYSEALAMFANQSRLIAVAGIHGKTTTTAMLSYLMKSANLDPSYIIGAGGIGSLDSTGHAGNGEYFIVEADEYRKNPEDSSPKFLDLQPEIEIITSIELDHPDIYSSEEEIYKAFYNFACKIPRKGYIVICNDYIKAHKLQRTLVDRNFETYGFNEDAQWKITEYSEEAIFCKFSLLHDNKTYGPFEMQLFGKGNVLNATSAIIVCLKAGMEIKQIVKYLRDFKGAKRRFEVIGKAGEHILIDDYAHHPRSIALLLETIKAKYPNYQIWCIFQPHTYSRTKQLLNEFSMSFKNATKVIVTDIYASARETGATIGGQDLVNKIKENQKNVKYISDFKTIIEDITDSISAKSVILTVGAGDIYKLGPELLKELGKNER